MATRAPATATLTSAAWLAIVTTFKPGAQTVAVGQATETDTAQAISWAPKRRLVGQVSETDLAQGMTSRSPGPPRIA